ncbi:MAG: hypothetical protein IJL78_11010 [Lachnospiraceae bacterium]|nr:hypothetical protein [Lachnospiraceae bacterium]
MPYCTVEPQVHLYYEEYGEGERYLLSTQIGHGRETLEKELAKRGFHVFLLTNRGFGRSTHIYEKLSGSWYDMWADDVVRFADCMGISTFSYSGFGHALDIYEDMADEAVRFYENWKHTGRFYAPVDPGE